jgi:hypothetical protein
MKGRDLFDRLCYCFLFMKGRSSARGKPSATIYVTIHSVRFSWSRRARFLTFFLDLPQYSTCSWQWKLHWAKIGHNKLILERNKILLYHTGDMNINLSGSKSSFFVIRFIKSKYKSQILDVNLEIHSDIQAYFSVFRGDMAKLPNDSSRLVNILCFLFMNYQCSRIRFIQSPYVFFFNQEIYRTIRPGLH